MKINKKKTQVSVTGKTSSNVETRTWLEGAKHDRVNVFVQQSNGG